MTRTVLSEHHLTALHPFSGETSHLKLEFGVRRFANALEFDFIFFGRVAADLERLVLPPLAERRLARRKHELWKTTCLEVFFANAAGPAYVELNLSPAGDWNVYGFDSYRGGQIELYDARAQWLQNEKSANGDRLAWRGQLSSVQSGGPLATVLSASHLVMSATCVMEYKTGEREYWALAHAGEKPDFHRRESFRISL